MENRQATVSFFGHFGSGNVGNESTLLAILYHLRSLLPEASFRCICTGPATAARIHNITAVPIRRPLIDDWRPRSRVARWFRSLFIGIPNELYGWIEAFKTLKGAGALIIPGTGLLTDAYGRLEWGPYFLFKWLVVAKLRGCKVLFVSVGAGPLYGRLSKLLVKASLTLADFRSYRDVSSMLYLKSLGFVRKQDKIYPDLAFSLPFASHRSRKNTARTVVGLGLMTYAGKYSVENPSMTTYRNYLNNLVSFVQWLLENEYEVKLLTIDVTDRPTADEFKRLLKERLVTYDPARIVDVAVSSVEGLVSQFAETDLVVATRFHNVLLALLCDKPVISISFHHKCSSLMSQMELSEYSQDIKDLSVDKLIEQLCQLQQNADCVKRIIREKVAACRHALDEQYRIIFRDICPDREAPTGATQQTPTPVS